ncbi:MAG: hypothetical protein KBA50_09305 [Sedimentibacter sp.]|nr:hypothetical protein [Sedimentibacter sp.]
MFGRMPQLSGNDKENITALYDYVTALRRELNDMLFNLDSENIREINAEIVNVYNLNAANIKANTIMSNVNMIIGSGNNVFKADPKGIYLGDADFEDAPFSVDMEGNLYASSATIIGDIIGGTINIDTDARVGRNLYLGRGYQYSASISFDGIGSIEAEDNNLYFSAMEGMVFEAGSPVSFNDAVFFDDYVDFSGAYVDGLDIPDSTDYIQNMNSFAWKMQLFQGSEINFIEVWKGSSYMGQIDLY